MKKIVLGYDETDAAKRALERAAQLAKAFDSELTVISVAPVMATSTRSAGPLDPTDMPEKHQQELANAGKYLESEGVGATLQAAVGDPAKTIAELAHDRGADLIIVGTRDHNFAGRLFGQSVSDSVAHRVQCDVMIVH